MLERIESPDAVLAFRAVGKIDKSDYDSVLEPAVYAMLAQHGELRFVYVLGDEYDGMSAAAAWEDAKLGIGHLTKWKRVGVVTDHDWLRKSISMFGWMMPGDVKTFTVAELDAAIEWAAAAAPGELTQS